MIQRLVDWLIRFAQRTPYRHVPGYMERWWLIPYNRFGIAVRVHHILRSDDDRVFHDHPWNYLTIILRGGYTEVQPVFVDGLYIGERRTWRGPGSVLFRRASSWHRLEVPEGSTAWTLFVSGRKRQQWGFLRDPEFKVYWRRYLDDWTSEGTPGT